MIGRTMRGLFLGGTAAVLIAAAFALGMTSAFVLRPTAPIQIPEDTTAPANFKVYGEVWRYIDREYYGGRPASEQITRGALEGLVASLEDPWALLAPENAVGAEWFAPHYVSTMGAWIEPVAQGARVLAVVPEGGADAGGLQAGDLIVGAQPTEQEDSDAQDQADVSPSADTATDSEAMDAEAAAALFQPAEAEAPLVDVLEEAEGPLTIVLLRSGRAALQLEVTPDDGAGSQPEASVERLEDGNVLVRPQRIDAAGVDALVEALRARDEASEAADAMTSLVLDLRDNPGGDLGALAAMAGLFAEGPLWVEETRAADDLEITASEPGRGDATLDEGATLVVLVNGGTVGEAEMLAAALREKRGAVLLGEPSFGRATRSEVRPLDDGTLLRLSVARWRTIDGLTVAESGLEPDSVISGREAQREAGLAVAAGEPLPPSADEAEEASAGAGGG